MAEEAWRKAESYPCYQVRDSKDHEDVLESLNSSASYGRRGDGGAYDRARVKFGFFHDEESPEEADTETPGQSQVTT